MKLIFWLTLVIATAFISPSSRSSESIVAEGLIEAPVHAVWNAWTTSEGLRSWLAPHAEIDLRIDGIMRSNYDPKGDLDGPGTIENKILAFEPQRMLSIRVVRAPEKFPFKSKVKQMWTVLYFHKTDDEKTMLRIVGMGFGTDEESIKMKDYFKRGNAFTLTQLQKYFQH
jgi:uncharacterized protein YndB with AHSA1/START domain